MIARMWRGRATVENAPLYREHATRHVFPSLASIPGHRGAYLLTHEGPNEVEFLAVTLWDSLDSIKAFAGEDCENAVVEPQARAVLSHFETFAKHYEIAGSAPCGAIAR